MGEHMYAHCVKCGRLRRLQGRGLCWSDTEAEKAAGRLEQWPKHPEKWVQVARLNALQTENPGWSREQLARVLGVHPDRVSIYRRSIPDLPRYNIDSEYDIGPRRAQARDADQGAPPAG